MKRINLNHKVLNNHVSHAITATIQNIVEGPEGDDVMS